MKRFDDSTKKLIKNVAALLTSAVVLVAATIAWFATGSSDSKINNMRGNALNSLANVSYFRLHEPEDYLDSATTGTGSTALFTFGSDTGSSFTQPTLGDWMGKTWDPTTSGNGAWNITSLYPGEYDVFKITAQSSSPRLIINGILCTDIAGGNTLTDAQKEIIYKNVYLYAVAVKTTTTTDEQTQETTTTYAPFNDGDENNPTDCIVCGSFYDLVEKPSNWSVSGTQKIVILNNMNVSQYEDFTILLFIGVPGSSVTSESGGSAATDNLRSAHDLMRQSGAKLSFGPVYPFEITL